MIRRSSVTGAALWQSQAGDLELKNQQLKICESHDLIDQPQQKKIQIQAIQKIKSETKNHDLCKKKVFFSLRHKLTQ